MFCVNLNRELGVCIWSFRGVTPHTIFTGKRGFAYVSGGGNQLGSEIQTIIIGGKSHFRVMSPITFLVYRIYSIQCVTASSLRSRRVLGARCRVRGRK